MRAHRLGAFARTLSVVLLVVCGGVVACGEEPPPVSSEYECTVSVEQLAARTQCVDDADCPCGSFCEVGLCAYECTSDEECEGNTQCDAFGRCRDDSGGLTSPFPSGPVGRIVTEETSIDLDAAHLEGVLTIRAAGAMIAPVRVAAAAPVVLRCPGSDVDTSECRIESIAPGDDPIVVGVALRSAPDAEVSHDVRVFGGGEVIAVNVRATPGAPAAMRPLEGIWTGRATLIRSGSIARSASSDTPETLRAVTLPVEVRIFPESGGRRTVVMSDVSGFVFPESPTVGELLRASDGALRLQHVARPYVEGDAASVDAARVLASAQTDVIAQSRSGLVIDLRTMFSGIVGDAYAPFIDWRLALTRTADLPAGDSAPPLPAAATALPALDRAASPLRLETPARTALGPLLSGLSGVERAQAALCTPAAATDAILLASGATAPWSGDLGCDAVAPDDQPRVFGAYRESAWNIATTIGNCVDDLQLAEAISHDTPTSLTPAGCIDASRFAMALTEAQSVDLRRVQGEPVSPSPTQSAMAHRLVQQWSHMLSFVTAQAVQIDRLNDVLTTSAGVRREFTQRDMLELTAAGWDVLLHPRVAMPLTLLPGDVVRDPDYRLRLFPAGDFVADPRHDVGVGLPVALARDLARSLQSHGALLERARYVTSEREAIERLSVAFVRRSIALFAFATLLHDYARASSPSALPWASQWEHAASLYGVALGGLVRNLENLREGRNPLDIDDSLDLPLYRVGDEATGLDRFSAVTDYLIGTGSGGGDTSPVGAAVIASENALADARESYTNALRTDQLYQVTEQNQLNRRNAVREEFGEDIVSLCGDPDYDADPIIEGRTEVNPETCWIRQDCRRDPDAALTSMHPEDLAYNLCYVAGAREILGAGALPVAAASLSDAEVAPLVAASGAATLRGHSVTTTTVTVQLSGGGSISLERSFFDSGASGGNGATLSSEDALALHQRCRAVQNASAGARPRTAPSSCTFHGDCPSGQLCSAGACEVDEGTPEETSCFRGAVGAVAASLRSAVTDVAIARSELADLTRAYDIRMLTCADMIETNDEREAAVSAHLSTMTTLGTVKLAADIATHVAAGVKDCANTAAGDNTFGIASGVACGAAAAEATFASVSEGMEYAMNEAEREHEAAIELLDRGLGERTCQREAEMELVAVNTARLRIQRANDEVASLLVQLENGKVAIAGTLAEGIEELAVQTSIEITPIEFDFWLDANVVRYDAAFRRARRALYLGVIAVEYEYQLSSAERTSVLAATRVDELRSILTRLRNLAATGTVRGAAPSELHTVVSLRDELLAVADRSDHPEGAHALTPAERFRVMLSSPRFRVFDEDGAYLGQQVPFRLAPLGRLGATEPGTIPLLTGADCAERLWSINASILGDDVLHGSDSTRTRVSILKRNSFFSQWCGGATDEDPFQYASTRPSRNLFLDPFTDYLPGMHTPTPDGTSFREAAEADAFTSARLTPVIGVTRAELEQDAYFNGSSRELAGRGVYGDYALFIPAEVLARAGAPGLDLERVDDILLRIDYVSVASR